MYSKQTFALILVILTFINPVHSDSIFTFKGGHVTSDDLPEHAAIPLYEETLRLTQTKHQYYIQALFAKLVLLEEEKTGKTYIKQIQDYLKLRGMTDKNGLFEWNIEKQEYLINDADSNLERRKIENAYFTHLIEIYQVKNHLSYPEPPKINLNLTNKPGWGNPDAAVIVAEFSDLECRFCKKMQPAIRKIREEYKEKIYWVFVDMPMSFHTQAEKAHIATHCAGEQNRFFDFQNAAFQKAPDLSGENLILIAESLKLNMTRFKICLEDKNEKWKKVILTNIEYGSNIGISGTPTLFINGRYYPGLMEYKDLKSLIDKELEKKK